MRKLLTAVSAFMVLVTGAGAGVFSLFNPVEADSDRSILLQTQAFIADDPVSLHDLVNGWHGSFHPKKGTNLAIDDMRADIGFSAKRWGYFGYTYRHHSFTKASEDLTILAWQQLNDTAFTPGKLYNLDISVEGFEADGITYAKRFETLRKKEHSLTIGFGVELLRGRNMQDGYLRGKAIANSEKDYDFNAISDYRYTENYLYNLDVEQAEGYGYTTHLCIEYRYRSFGLQILANDLYGKIEWKRLPYSYVNVNSSNKKYDENGYVIYNPTISGIEKYIDYSQTLYRKWRTEGSYDSSKKTKWTVGADFVKGTWFTYLNVSHAFTKDLLASLSYEERFAMAGVDVNYKNFRISAKSNSLEHPSAIALSLFYRIFF